MPIDVDWDPRDMFSPRGDGPERKRDHIAAVREAAPSWAVGATITYALRQSIREVQN